MIGVTLRYYAQLREQAGTGGEHLATASTTPAELYAELRQRHGFALPAESVKVAINAAFTSWEQTLRDGDIVVFIPPVNGG